MLSLVKSLLLLIILLSSALPITDSSATENKQKMILEDSEEIRFEFLPSRNKSFAGFKGYSKESRLGLIVYSSDKHLKVDVGNSIDILKIYKNDYEISVGIDFTAYAYSTNTEKLRLQIDAVDGLFGGNITIVQKTENRNTEKPKNLPNWFLRFRFMHNSAHLVDGNWFMSEANTIQNPQNNSGWLKEEGPIPFTRDFIELFIGKVFSNSSFINRSYVGFEYTTHYRPKNQLRTVVSLGNEFQTRLSEKAIFEKDLNLLLNIFYYMWGESKYDLSQNYQLGVKFGSYFDRGILLFINYLKGNNVFNQYYTQKISRLGIGFEVEF